MVINSNLHITDENVSKLVSDITDADLAYMKAKDAGASQEELDRLKAESDSLFEKMEAAAREANAAHDEIDALRAQKVDDARAKAELASRDYLNALKTGDPEIIAAYKERLQEANDELLAAKREQEALNK